MSRTLNIGCVLIALVAMQQVKTAANGGGVSGGGASTPMAETLSPAQQARNAYNDGIGHRDKGNKFEAEASKQQPKDAEKTNKKAIDEYAKALKDFQKAARLDATLYPAWNGMGYAFRKTGDHEKALAAYQEALRLAPNFPDALEYQGEAFLGLNKIDDAKSSYLTLLGKDRKQADDLLKAMATWVAKHKTEPGTVSPATVEALDTWVKERAQIAASTVAMSLTDTRSIWK